MVFAEMWAAGKAAVALLLDAAVEVVPTFSLLDTYAVDLCSREYLDGTWCETMQRRSIPRDESISLIGCVVLGSQARPSSHTYKTQPLLFSPLLRSPFRLIGSTAGSNYFVRILSTLDREVLKPNTSVALHRHSHSVVEILPPESDSTIQLMQERPDVTYHDIGGMDMQKQEVTTVVILIMGGTGLWLSSFFLKTLSCVSEDDGSRVVIVVSLTTAVVVSNVTTAPALLCSPFSPSCLDQCMCVAQGLHPQQ